MEKYHRNSSGQRKNTSPIIKVNKALIKRHPDLTGNDLLIISEIIGIQKGTGKPCYASNEYFQDTLQMTRSTVQRSISKMESMDLIEQVKRGKSTMRSYIKIRSSKLFGTNE